MKGVKISKIVYNGTNSFGAAIFIASVEKRIVLNAEQAVVAPVECSDQEITDSLLILSNGQKVKAHRDIVGTLYQLAPTLVGSREKLAISQQNLPLNICP